MTYSALANGIERLPLLRRRPPTAYALTLLMCGLAWWLRTALAPFFPPGYPYLTFFPAVILASFLFGRGPGVVAGLLCGLLAWYFFIPPTHSFSTGHGTWTALGFYGGVVTVDIALVHWMQRANARLHWERERSGEAEERLASLNDTLEQRIATALIERQVLADVVEHSTAAVLVLGMDGRILAVNHANVVAFERAFGKRTAVGSNLFTLLDGLPEHRAQLHALWSRALAGEAFVVTEEFGDAALSRRCFEVRFDVLRDREGRQLGAVSTSYDVSARVRAEADLVAAQDQLRQSQKMEAVGQLTGGVAHDFNNLLTVIRGSIDLLRRPDLPEARRQRYMDAVSDTVDRAARLTGQLLAFARRQALTPEVFDVGAKVRGVAEMLDTVTGARVQVEVDVPDAPCFVRADVSQFETALVNLAVNARDAMDGEGLLVLQIVCGVTLPPIRGHAGSAELFTGIRVRDTGTGIPAEQLEHIFEPFFTTKEVGKGTGLGLSQVFGFAKQSGGDVDVRSRVGEGTTFTLFLPEQPEPPEPGDEEAIPSAALPEGRLRVLVVEDNHEVGQFCTQILEDLGHRTVLATDAETALARLKEQPNGFDAVFSDVVMPGRSGLELARTIRERMPQLPVVLASGYSHVLASDTDHGFELLHKPYSADQLALVLRRATAKARRG